MKSWRSASFFASIGFSAGALALCAVLSLVGAAGCGYAFQNSHNELLEKEGVRRVYVEPLVNDTYKAGIENVVYNALIRTLISHKRVKIVQRREDADAVLTGQVTASEYGVSAQLTGNTLAGAIGLSSPIDFSNTSVAAIYTASLRCNFSLSRRNPLKGQRGTLWGAAFSRDKPFQAANQLDVPGTTSALINESEFERALSDLATLMMEDLHESMLAMF